jgi:hypothetical protein
MPPIERSEHDWKYGGLLRAAGGSKLFDEENIEGDGVRLKWADGISRL